MYKDFIKKEKQKIKNDIVLFTKKEYQEHVDKIRRDTIALCIELTASVSCLALNNEFGFGKKRLDRYMTRYDAEMGCINYGSLSKQDVDEWCEKKKIQIKRAK